MHPYKIYLSQETKIVDHAMYIIKSLISQQVQEVYRIGSRFSYILFKFILDVIYIYKDKKGGRWVERENSNNCNI